MLLFEFDTQDPLRVKLTAVASQLKSRRADTGAKKPMSTDALLTLLRDNEIAVSKEDLYDMIKKAPLKNIIQNISGRDVIFKGGTEDKDVDTDQDDDNKKQVEKMAAKATKQSSGL
jgi:hypothetical protein